MEEPHICPACNQEVKIPQTRGLHNWRNLFKAPTLNDWITLFIITMILVSAWAYNHDTKTCRDTLNNLDKVCANYVASTNRASNDSNYFVWKNYSLAGIREALQNESVLNESRIESG